MVVFIIVFTILGSLLSSLSSHPKVNFGLGGEDIWEDAYVVISGEVPKKRLLVYSHFNGIYEEDGMCCLLSENFLNSFWLWFHMFASTFLLRYAR